MKHERFSDDILCGYKMVDGRQHFGAYADDKQCPTRVCVLGAAALCEYGSIAAALAADWVREQDAFADAFLMEWGFAPQDLNDGDVFGLNECMPWEHIYGMARAAGL